MERFLINDFCKYLFKKLLSKDSNGHFCFVCNKSSFIVAFAIGGSTSIVANRPFITSSTNKQRENLTVIKLKFNSIIGE